MRESLDDEASGLTPRHTARSAATSSTAPGHGYVTSAQSVSNSVQLNNCDDGEDRDDDDDDDYDIAGSARARARSLRDLRRPHDRETLEHDLLLG